MAGVLPATLRATVGGAGFAPANQSRSNPLGAVLLVIIATEILFYLLADTKKPGQARAFYAATLWQASCLPPFGPPLAVLVLLLQTSRGVIRSGATPLGLDEDNNTIGQLLADTKKTGTSPVSFVSAVKN